MSRRLQPLRRALALAAPAQGGRGSGPRAAGDRAGHAAAGRHRPVPPLVRHAGRRRDARRVRRLEARASARSRRASPPPRRGPAQPVLVSVFLEGGADALSVLSPQGDPLYRKLRPKLALAGGTAFAEDSRLFWHPAAGGLAQLYGEKKVSVMPAIGYTNADQSHFTSRHYWEVGATSTDLRTGWLGRYLDGVGDDGQPAAGTLARRHARAGARDGEGAGRVDRRPRPVRLLEQPRLGRGRDADARARSARSARARRRSGARRGRRRHRAGRPAAQPAAPVPGGRRQAGVHEPGGVPEVGRRVPAAARRPRRDAREPGCRCTSSR